MSFSEKVKTQTVNGAFTVYKRCADPCYLYFHESDLLPPECGDIPAEFDCPSTDIVVWRVQFECNPSTVPSVPDQYRVIAERLCYTGTFPDNATLIAGTILISGTATVDMLCDETGQVHGVVTAEPTASLTPWSCDIPFWIRKDTAGSCDSCGTASCLDIDPTCTTGGGGGGGGGGDPGGP